MEERRRIIDNRNKEKFQMDDLYLNGYARHCGIYATGVYVSLCRHANRDQYCFPSFKLIAEELAISEKSVQRAVVILVEWNIIELIRSKKPDGTWQNNRYILLDKSVWKEKPQASGADGVQQSDRPVDIQRTVSPEPADSQSKIQQSDRPQKETHIKETHIKESNASVAGREINDLLEKFKSVNPSYEQMFKNTTERAALARLVTKYGVEKVGRMIDTLSLTNAQQYAPVITTPYQLEKNLGRLIAFVQKQNGKGPMLVTI
jgi:hypothetical protein